MRVALTAGPAAAAMDCGDPEGFRHLVRSSEGLAGSILMEATGTALPRIVAAAGGDFILFDMEHGAHEVGGLRDALAVCRAVGLSAIVRIPSIESSVVARVLDAGAHAILAPMVETADQAARLVEFGRYPPAGRRGAAFGIAHDDYRTESGPAETAAAANRAVALLCMIETPTGIGNLDDILAVDGIDGCWFGYIDYAAFAGISGQLAHADVIAARRAIGQACRAAGKGAGIMATSREMAEQCAADGYRLLAWASDVHLLRSALADGFRTCRNVLQSIAFKTGT